MTKLLSCNLSDDLMEKLESEAKKHRKTKTEITQEVFTYYFERTESKHGNLQLVLSKFDETKYENAKTRALLLEIADRLGVAITEIEMDEVEEDARAYVEQPLAPSVGG